MEDTMGALDRWPNGSRVDEVHLEQPETRVGAAHGLQVLRLALIFCSENPAGSTGQLNLRLHGEQSRKRSGS